MKLSELSLKFENTFKLKIKNKIKKKSRILAIESTKAQGNGEPLRNENHGREQRVVASQCHAVCQQVFHQTC